MKKHFSKVLAIILTLALAIPMIASSQPMVVQAASARMNTTWKTISMGNSYTFWVKNATNVKSKAWSSTKPGVATVNGKGVVTPVSVGKTTIKCKITYTNGTTQTVSAVAAVKANVPASKVTITNKDLGAINAHTMEVGSKYTFKITKAPSNTTDYGYFTIADEEYASVTSAGVVTAKKAGVTMLEVRTGSSAAEAAKGTVVDRVYLYITEAVKPTATPTPTPTAAPTPTPIVSPSVQEVVLVSSKEIQIRFNDQIAESSIIDGTGSLISGTITIGLDPKAVVVTPLVPTLSSDKKTLSLTTNAEFKGIYVITVSQSVKTLSGTQIAPFTVQKSFEDKTGPIYQDTTLDDTGYICSINFNEPLDISAMTIYSVDGTTSTELKTVLSNAGNYTLSADKKSLIIDLSVSGQKVAGATVKILGIKDLVGNASPSFPVVVLARLDATQKPLAKIVSVERTSKTLLTAKFDRALVYAGYIIVNNEVISGVIDSKDNTKVNYTLTNASLTGTQVVEFNGWYSYNAASYQTTAEKRAVSFSLDTTAPVVTSYSLKNATENNLAVTKLNVTYNKPVSIVEASGKVNVKIQGMNGNIYNKELSYTASAKDNILTVVFGNNQATESGTYIIDLPAGLVVDTLGNLSTAKSISMTKELDDSSVLPPPTQIAQDPSDPSKVKIYFGTKLDMATVADLNNYTFGTNVHPVNAAVIEQNEASAVVELTFAPGALNYTFTYPVVISGIKGYNNSYGPMKDYQATVPLVENVPAIISSCKLTSSSVIELKLTENVIGSAKVSVYSNGTMLSADCNVVGDTLYIVPSTSITGSANYLVITENNLVDVNGNKAALTLNAQISISRAY